MRDDAPTDIGIGVLDTLRVPFVLVAVFVLLIVTAILMFCAMPFEIIDRIVTRTQRLCGYPPPEPTPDAA